LSRPPRLFRPRWVRTKLRDHLHQLSKPDTSAWCPPPSPRQRAAEWKWRKGPCRNRMEPARCDRKPKGCDRSALVPFGFCMAPSSISIPPRVVSGREEDTMPTYRAYLIDGDDRVASYEPIEAETDAEALK